MRKRRKLTSIGLVFFLIMTIFNGLIVTEVGADALITLTVDKDADLMDKITEDSVTLEWNQVSGARSYLITYRDYSSDNIGVDKEVYVNSPLLTSDITGLVSDILYSFTIQAKDDVDGNGTILATDQLKVITSMTFNSTNLDDTFSPSGTKEAGVNPGLKLQWNIPKMWDGSSFVYVPRDNIDYRITAGTDEEASNIGKYQINYDGSNYAVYLESVTGGVSTVTALAYAPLNLSGGRISYEWWRYENPASDYTAGNINDDKIKPGTVYYMKLFPQFKDTGALTIGRTKYNISSLENGYIATPLHIVINKDGNNNVICTIYRVNQNSGSSQGIINFRYEVRSSPDPGLASPVVEGFEYEEYGDPTQPVEIFIPPKDRTATYYYMAVARSDGMDDINSPIIDYTIAVDGTRPHIPQNVSVEDMNIVSAGAVKSADIVFKWDRPVDFDDISSELEYHILLSSAPADIVSPQGVYNKELIDGIEYDIKYRTVKVVDADSASIDLTTPGAIMYTLKGLELFTDDDGTPLANPDGYPAQLKLNKIYYVKIYSQKKGTQIVSDYSIPLSFTTPSESIRKPPVPEMFNVYQIASDEIQLAWSKAVINLPDYDADPSAGYSVTYDVYMNDSLEKDSDGNYIRPFLYLGNTNDPVHAAFIDGTGENLNARFAIINAFAGNDEVTARFGDGIKPDSTYYFIARTKLSINGQPIPPSDFSQVLSATTPRDSINPPGDNEKVPKAPIDFAVDVDSEGNKKIDSHSVTFKWTWLEENATYRLGVRELESGSYNEYLADDLSLVPVGQSVYTFAVQQLKPNALYHFSLRAERQVTEGGQPETLESPWITLPVTTTVLDAPQALETVSNSAYNRYTQLNVRWVGRDGFSFEVWLKAENQDQYTRWTNITTSSSKPIELQSTSYSSYYALISGLRSNTRYYIKVRAVDTWTDAGGISVTSYSKFAGPVSTKTEFNQSDYDDTQQEQEQEAVFMDGMQDLRNGLWWYVIDNDTNTQLKLKELKTVSEMANNNSDRLIVSLAGTKNNTSRYVVLVPLNVFEYMSRNKELLVFKAGFGEVSVRPDTIGVLSGNVQPDVYYFKDRINQSSSYIKDIYVRFTIQKIDSSSSDVSSSMKNNLESDVINLTSEVLGLSNTEEYTENLIKTRMDSIIAQKLADFRNRSASEKDTAAEIESLIKSYRDSARSELASYADSLINTSYGLIREVRTVKEFTNPIGLKLSYKPKQSGNQGRSAYFYRDSKWDRVPTNIDNTKGMAVFESLKPVETAVYMNAASFRDTGDSTKTAMLNELDSRYDIYSIMTESGTYYGTSSITMKQMLAVAGKVLGEDINSGDKDIVSRISGKLGLNSKIGKFSDSHNLTREEAAYIAVMLYAKKAGLSVEKLKPAKTVQLADTKQVNPIYYKAIEIAIDLKLIKPDKTGKILATSSISKEDTLAMLAQVLKLTGEL